MRDFRLLLAICKSEILNRLIRSWIVSKKTSTGFSIKLEAARVRNCNGQGELRSVAGRAASGSVFSKEVVRVPDSHFLLLGQPLFDSRRFLRIEQFLKHVLVALGLRGFFIESRAL